MTFRTHLDAGSVNNDKERDASLVTFIVRVGSNLQPSLAKLLYTAVAVDTTLNMSWLYLCASATVNVH